MPYRALATSVEGFVQQIACCYLRHGYWWYVTGRIPGHKDPRRTDEKLIQKYGIDVSESTRSRRKRLGRANLQYIRHQNFFVLLATKGEHPFFQEEAAAIRDIRRIPLRFAGYSISYRRGGRTRRGEKDAKWHAHVEIERQRYLELRDHFSELATTPVRRSISPWHFTVCRLNPTRRFAGRCSSSCERPMTCEESPAFLRVPVGSASRSGGAW